MDQATTESVTIDPATIDEMAVAGAAVVSAAVVSAIDDALERFASRDVVPASEVIDLLLDLRTLVSSDAALAALLESEAQPAN